MNAAGDHGRGEMMRACDDVGDDFGVLWVGNAGFEDADDFRRPFTKAAEANGLADDRRILAESGGPETIGENDDSGSIGAIVLRADEAPENGMKAHHIEKRAADNATSNGTRLTEADHGEIHAGEVAECAQGFDTSAQVLDLRYGKGGVFIVNAGRALPDIDQMVLVTVDQGLEKDAAHQREDSRVGADAKRQCENHRDRQPGSTS